MKIILKKNYGYKWTKEKDFYFKGYFIKNKKLYENKDAINEIKKLNEKSLISFLDGINGCFAFIIDGKERTIIVTDIARSMPIYYNEKGGIISDSSEEIRKELNIEKEYVNETNLLEFFMKGCIDNNNTVYDEIKTLDLGQYAIFENNKIKLKYYYRHYTKTEKRNKEIALKDFKKAIDKTFDNLIIAINKRQILLSLSGGYDSRFIACTLKEKGIENVICYTYGKKDSFEVKESKKVADSLQYKWINIEYTKEMIRDLLSEEEYFNMTLEHDYTIYLQNYLAVKKIKLEHMCDDDAVCITGLCADMPTGYYVHKKDSYDINTLINEIYDYYFPRRKLKDKVEEDFKMGIKKDIESLEIPCNSAQNYVKIKDCIATGYEHSKKFLNMNRVHEFFGYQWLIPCWDKNFLNFWYSLEMKYRINQNLYEEYLLNDLCKKYGVNRKKTIAQYSSNQKIKNIKYFIGGIVRRITLPLNININRSVDINNFSSLELAIYKRIKNKSVIVYKRSSLSQLLTIYILEQRYGFKNVKKLKKHFK